MLDVVKRNVEFEGIFLTPNPGKKPFYGEGSVRRAFGRDSCVMSQIRLNRLFGEFGLPDTSDLICSAAKLRRRLEMRVENIGFQITALDYDLHECGNVKVLYPRADILLVGPQCRTIDEQWKDLCFVPRVIYDRSDEKLYLTRIITWDAVLRDKILL